VKRHAALGGDDGIRYPWEQAYTGYDTCPWDKASMYQLHVTADVSYALRQYLYATNDVDILRTGKGRKLAVEIARFWSKRAKLISAEKGYGIYAVMGPDEYHYNVNNSIFTNYNAKLSLLLPSYIQDTLGMSYPASVQVEISKWLEQAAKMYLPFDSESQYHPQFDGFDIKNSTIKQSDVVLLGYPLMMEMTPTVRKNDLVIYEELTDKYGPDTGTWSMHTVGWLELGNYTKANEMFEVMFRNVNGPFKIFSEKPADGEEGMRCTNFITGAGGMLQSVVFGYGGIRLRGHSMEISPAMIPGASLWQIKGLHYRSAIFDLIVDNDHMTLTLTSIEANRGPDMYITYGNTNAHGNKFELGIPIKLSHQTVRITTKREFTGTISPSQIPSLSNHLKLNSYVVILLVYFTMIVSY
ncbi:unnamed protein product, partial [Owenia fusiformis]